MKRVFTIALFSIFLVPTLAFAQFSGFSTDDYATELSMNVSPAYPAPGDRVSISLEMYNENLNTASITWYQDGKVVQQGNGKKSFSLTAPRTGETRVTVNITTALGVSFSKSVAIRPASVDLVWEGDTYTPPFYKGRSLWSAQGYVRMLAVPSFGNPAQLVYTWKINNEVSNQSGYGRNSIYLINNGLGGNLQVELFVSDPVTNTAAEKFLIVPQVEPSITFYENNPLYGIVFDRAVTTVDMDRGEISILAAPFDLVATRPTDLSYKWNVNNAAVEAYGRAITLRKPESGSGSSSISLKVTNASKIMQFAEGNFLVKFK